LDQFNYYSDTYTATDSLLENKGNCLSPAILTKALADLVDVEVGYQLVETAPVFKKEGNIILSSQHIRTMLFSPDTSDSNGWVLFRGRIIVDYFPTYSSHILREVDEDEFTSMYYTNKAAESMLRQDNNLTYWYLNKALKLKPTHSIAINMMALLHQKVGYPDYAERLFLCNYSA